MVRIGFLLLLLQPALVFCQQRPLVTERARTLPPGQVLLDLGVEFLQKTTFPFSGIEGDLTRLGVLGVRVGVGRVVEIQTLGVIQDVLNIGRRFPAPNTSQLDFSGNSTSDFGNFSLATKVLLKQENKKSPAFGMRFGVELPNTANESGLGNDETNVFATLLIEKELGKLRLLGNLGAVILGDPVQAGSEDDLFSYGTALLYSIRPGLVLVGDLYGRAGRGGIGTEPQSLLRLGAQIQAVGLFWDIGVLSGFRQTDPSSGIILGVSKSFNLSRF